MGIIYSYIVAKLVLIVIILPFAFAYFLEMEKELKKIQNSISLIT